MRIDDVISKGGQALSEFPVPASLFREHGIDLASVDPRGTEIRRGTPVYVESDADADLVKRHMVLLHVRLVFVLSGDEVRGVIDIVDLAWFESERQWPGVRDPAHGTFFGPSPWREVPRCEIRKKRGDELPDESGDP